MAGCSHFAPERFRYSVLRAQSHDQGPGSPHRGDRQVLHGHGSGGILGLARFIEENYEACEAAFQRDYGEALAQALWGPDPMSVRRLLSLVRGLAGVSVPTERPQEPQ